MNPRVSILLPVRDGERFLAEALRSIQAQSFADWELIAVDDASRDGTAAILAEHATRDRRVVVIQGTGRGIVPALSHAIAVARAPYLARMDADDVARADRLARQIEELDRRPSLAALGSAARAIDAAGHVLGRIGPPTDPTAIRARLKLGNCMIHPSVVLRREALASVGAYRAAYVNCEDYDLWLRLSERHDLANLEEELLDYRVHGSQATHRSVEPRILAEIAALEGASRRKTGGSDFGDPEGGFTRSGLLAAGVSDLNRKIVRHALNGARGAISVGHEGGARAALEVAWKERDIGAKLSLRRAETALRLRFGSFKRRP